MSQGENFEVQRARKRMDSRTIWNSEMTTHRIGGKPIRECQKHQSLTSTDFSAGTGAQATTSLRRPAASSYLRAGEPWPQ